MRRSADRRTRDAYDRCLPNPSNGYGHPDPVGHRSCAERCGRRFTTSLRASVLWILPRAACSACEREESGTSGVPVVHRRLRSSMKESAVGHGPRSIHVGPREREDATPTRNVSIRRPRVCTLGGPRNGVRGARRRSLGDALDGATRTRDQVTPGALGLLACDCGSAPNRHSSRAAFVRPSRQEESATRCHDRGCTRSRLLRDHHSRGGSGLLENASSARLVHDVSRRRVAVPPNLR